MKRRVLHAVLTNNSGKCFVASFDWITIMSSHGSSRGGPEDRRNEDGSISWTEQEAADMADSLERSGPGDCSNWFMVDLDYEDGIRRGSSAQKCEDGLTPEQRMKKLVTFLRQGDFRWRFHFDEDVAADPPIS